MIKDPAVASATANIGPGGATVTENDGRVFITLKPRGQRTATADQVIARLNRALRAGPGHHPLHAGRAGHQRRRLGCPRRNTSTRSSTWTANELNHWAPILLQKLKALPQLTDVASDQQSAGRTLNIEVNRELASRLGIDPDRSSIRFSTTLSASATSARIYTRLNQYYVILEVDPDFQLGPERSAAESMQRRPAAHEVPLSEFASYQPDGRAARGQPSGPVPFGDAELQSARRTPASARPWPRFRRPRSVFTCRARSPPASRATRRRSRTR